MYLKKASTKSSYFRLSTHRRSLLFLTKSITFPNLGNLKSVESMLQASNPALPTPPLQWITTFPLFSIKCLTTTSTTSWFHFSMSCGGAISMIGYLNRWTPFFWQAASYCFTLAPMDLISTSLRRQTIRVTPWAWYCYTSRVISLL